MNINEKMAGVRKFIGVYSKDDPKLPKTDYESVVLDNFKVKLEMLQDQAQDIIVSKDGFFQHYTLEEEPLDIWGIVCYNFPLDRLKLDGEYNRSIMPANVKNLKKSMEKNGRYPFQFGHVELQIEEFEDSETGEVQIMIVAEVIDKQHTTKASIELGFDSINVILYAFPVKQDKIDYYINMNKWQKGTSHPSEFLALACNGDPIARFIYRLHSDPKYLNSFRRFKLQKPFNPEIPGEYVMGAKTNVETTFTTSQSEAMLRVLLLNSNTETKEFNRGPLNLAVENEEYNELADRVEEFITLYFNAINYQHDNTVRAFFSFYLTARAHINFDSVTERKNFCKKLSSMSHKKLQDCGSRQLAVDLMRQTWNSGKQLENQIPFIPITKGN